MSVALQFKLTTTGAAACWNMSNTGLSLGLTHIQLGSGNKAPTGTELALVTPQQVTPIAAGFSVPTSTASSSQIRMAAIFSGTTSFTIREVGVWAGDPAVVGSKLVGYWSQASGDLAVKSSGVDFIFAHDMVLDGAVSAGSLTIIADNSQSTMLAMLMAHEAKPDPHPQYLNQDDVQRQLHTSFTTTGTAPAYIGTMTPGPTALTSPLRGRAKFHSGTNSASTLNVNGLGAKPIKQMDSTGALVDAVLFANQLADLEFDGTNWVVLDLANAVCVGGSLSLNNLASGTRAGIGADLSITNAFSGNLNDLKSPGEYFYSMACLNSPSSTNNGVIKVWRESADWIYHFAQEAGTGQIYVRKYNQGAWSAWSRYVRNGDYGLGADLSVTNGFTGNLNDLKQPGDYFYSMTCLNSPTSTSNGVIKVWRESTDWIYHFAQEAGTGQIYVRKYNQGTWSAWTRYLTTLDFATSFAAQGFVRIPSGLYIQWGTISTLAANGINGTVGTFPIAFPNACLQMSISDSGSAVGGFAASAISNTQYKAWSRDVTVAGAPYSSFGGRWIAIGY